jgi:hypothetical protein
MLQTHLSPPLCGPLPDLCLLLPQQLLPCCLLIGLRFELVAPAASPVLQLLLPGLLLQLRVGGGAQVRVNERPELCVSYTNAP